MGEPEDDDQSDLAFELRAWLYELYEWFRDSNRLNRAQDAIGDPRDWAARVAEEAEHASQRGHDRTPIARLTLVDALRSLEVADLAARLVSKNWMSLPQRCGTGERARYVVRRVRTVRPLSGRQSGRVSVHLRYHMLVPPKITVAGGDTFTVRFEQMCTGRERAEVVNALRGLMVATTSFEDGGDIDWGTPHGPARTVAGAGARSADLLRTVKSAAAARVDVLVAPELTLPPAQRKELHGKLAELDHHVALAVLGSFHEERRDRGKAPRVFNIAQLVDGKGNLIFEHRKLIRFGDLDVPTKPPESIDTGNEIRVLVSPFGTVAVAICRDFCEDRFGILWQEIQPDLLLVPAYGSGASAHARAAREAARDAGTVTVVAHEALDSLPIIPKEPGDPKGSSFVHTALQHGETPCHEHAPLFKAVNIPLSLDDQKLDRRGQSN